MGFMDGNKIKHVVTAKELDARLREEILGACDFSKRGRGRPKIRLLGTEPMQMSIDVAHRIVDLVVEQIAGEKGELETRLSSLHDRTGRRMYAARLLARMSRLNDGAVSDDPVERLWKMLGDLVCIGKRKTGEGRPQLQFVNKTGATQVCLSCAWGERRKKAAEHDVRASRINDIFARALPGMSNEVDFSEHYAVSLEAYHRRKPH